MSDPVKPDGNSGGGESFLSRWSRRKVAEKSAAVGVVDEAPNSSTGADSGTKMAGTPLPERTLPAGTVSAPGDESEAKAPLPDIESLTLDADFSPFMAKEVDPALRNQAMKKLFADPHYQFENMDKLDIYIDDYTKSDPIPLEILKKMYQSRALSIFDDEEDDKKEKPSQQNLADAAPPVSADADGAPALPESSAGPQAIDNAETAPTAPENPPPDPDRQQ